MVVAKEGPVTYEINMGEIWIWYRTYVNILQPWYEKGKTNLWV